MTTNVYVVCLDDTVKEKYPEELGSNPDLPAVYVGQSYHEPETRFSKHRRGERASRFVRDYGIELIPRLYKAYNPLLTRDQAERVEAALAEKLRRLGYTVFGGH